MIIEDDTLLAEVYQKSLAIEGIGSIIATSKQQVVSKYQPQTVALIMLDVVLSDSNGFEILKYIRRLSGSSTIPVIIVTGLNTDEVQINSELMVSLNIIGIYTKSQLPIKKLVEIVKLGME